MVRASIEFRFRMDSDIKNTIDQVQIVTECAVEFDLRPLGSREGGHRNAQGHFPSRVGVCAMPARFVHYSPIDVVCTRPQCINEWYGHTTVNPPCMENIPCISQIPQPNKECEKCSEGVDRGKSAFPRASE